ncbi:hypothetical protein ACH5RR_004798 [Cinchona calisaya]|uniref:Uncharacterized protein n=1 Tax=Cinchona calisaya TaxID=153742 RepID=A0ABD3AZI6_9GENT
MLRKATKTKTLLTLLNGQRVLDIIASKLNVVQNREKHIRLIEDLRTNSLKLPDSQGFVKLGRLYFDILAEYGIEPGLDIYSWSSRIHGNVWVGIETAKNRLLLEQSSAATHVSDTKSCKVWMKGVCVSAWFAQEK